MRQLRNLPRVSPDVILLRRVRRGDREAFDALFDVYFRRVHRFLEGRIPDPRIRREATEAVLARWFDIMTGSAEPEEEPARSALALAQFELVRRGLGEKPQRAGPRAAPRPRRGPGSGRERG